MEFGGSDSSEELVALHKAVMLERDPDGQE